MVAGEGGGAAALLRLAPRKSESSPRARLDALTSRASTSLNDRGLQARQLASPLMKFQAPKNVAAQGRTARPPRDRPSGGQGARRVTVDVPAAPGVRAATRAVKTVMVEVKPSTCFTTTRGSTTLPQAREGLVAVTHAGARRRARSVAGRVWVCSGASPVGPKPP